LPGGAIVSTGDALAAWLANQLGSKLMIYAINARGKDAVAPPDCIGNVCWSPCVLPSSNDGQWSATDIRRAVTTHKKDNIHSIGCIPTAKFGMCTNWTKVQHSPNFGAEMYYSLLAHAGWFNFPAPFHTIYQATPQETVIISSGLTAKQAADLQTAWKELGVTSVHINPARTVIGWDWQK